MRRLSLALFFALAVSIARGQSQPRTSAQTSAPSSAWKHISSDVLKPPVAKEFDFELSAKWLDTGLDLKENDLMQFTVTGDATHLGKPVTPDGTRRGFADLVKAYPLNDSNKGALLGRITDNPAARPFLIGSSKDTRALISGRLFLGLNIAARDVVSGSFHVKVEIAAAPPAAPESAIVPLSQRKLDTLPARVSDPAGAAGDRINFLIVGSEEQMQLAFKNAGWVAVDKSVKASVINGVLMSLTKQAYVTIPMSELDLFGRPQDFGYAQADPISVAASRHHFRIWKAPFTHESKTVWVGAGTHDIGFDRDQRNGNLTHKIDPNTDLEREYIGESLRQTGMVAKLDYMVPAETIKDARTAHGEEFRSDGRTLIIYLRHSDGTGSQRTN